MITLKEVEEAIRDLEQGSATYNNCMKLAALYTIRDEMRKEGRGNDYSMYTGNYGHYPYPYDNRNYYGRDNRTMGMYYDNNNNNYGYRPMSHYEEDDLMIRKDNMLPR